MADHKAPPCNMGRMESEGRKKSRRKRTAQLVLPLCQDSRSYGHSLPAAIAEYRSNSADVRTGVRWVYVRDKEERLTEGDRVTETSICCRLRIRHSEPLSFGAVREALVLWMVLVV